MRSVLISYCVFTFFTTNILSQNADFQNLRGLYFGQKPPGLKPRIFLKSKHRIHSSPAFSPDGKEVYWSVFPRTNEFSTRTQVILFSKLINEKWTSPELASFSGKYFDGGPFFSFDGKKLYFYSLRPLNSTSNKQTEGEIWYVEKDGETWSKPHHLAIDMKGDKLFFSFAKNNNLYFTSGHGPRGVGSGNVDVYVTRFHKDSYSKPEKLPDIINTRKYLESDVLVSPDEKYLIFFSFERPGNFGQYDLYVSFKSADQWSKPVNLGEEVNKGYSRFPGFSPDGRYLFFVRQISEKGIFWVSTQFIEKLKPKDLK
jgi:hypothetical protein